MKHLLAAIAFIAYVQTPMGFTKRYIDVQSYKVYNNGTIKLQLLDGKMVLAPIMWTVIEEK